VTRGGGSKCPAFARELRTVRGGGGSCTTAAVKDKDRTGWAGRGGLDRSQPRPPRDDRRPDHYEPGVTSSASEDFGQMRIEPPRRAATRPARRGAARPTYDPARH